ncbi:MAG: DUF3006 domain-containing protein [Trueperaceae bacterium]
MNRFVLERFEDNGWAMLERDDGELCQVPRAWLPSAAREGHVLAISAVAREPI